MFAQTRFQQFKVVRTKNPLFILILLPLAILAILLAMVFFFGTFLVSAFFPKFQKPVLRSPESKPSGVIDAEFKVLPKK